MAQPDRTGQLIVQEDLLFAVVRAMNWETRKGEALERTARLSARPVHWEVKMFPQLRSYRASAAGIVLTVKMTTVGAERRPKLLEETLPALTGALTLWILWQLSTYRRLKGQAEDAENSPETRPGTRIHRLASRTKQSSTMVRMKKTDNNSRILRKQ
jgi:hypothetical protein